MNESRKPSNELTGTELLREVDQFILEARETLRKGVKTSANLECTQATRKVEQQGKLESA